VPLPRPTTSFDPPIDQFLTSRSADHLTVLSGPNNSGKTYLLKHLRRELGSMTHFLGVSRFFTMKELGVGEPRPNYVGELFQQFQGMM
jgi:hypothetical protein